MKARIYQAVSDGSMGMAISVLLLGVPPMICELEGGSDRSHNEYQQIF